VLRADGDLAIIARTTSAAEPAELSRVYRFDTGSGAFDGGGLKRFGLHLPGDVHIPVRGFTVRVVSTLPVLATLPDLIDSDPFAAAAPASRPGDQVFVLAPAAIRAPLRLTAVAYPGGRPAVVTDPSPAIAAPALKEGQRAFIGDGGIFAVSFSADDPPEEPATLTFSLDAGTAGNSATLEASVSLTPHFRLTAPSLQVARGASLTLSCTDSVSAGAVVVTPSDGVTATVAAGGADITLQVDAGAALGPRRVLVEDAGVAGRKARRTIEIVA
jgi:hypothetical protein